VPPPATRDYRESFFLIEASLDPNDRSPTLQRLTARLGRRV